MAEGLRLTGNRGKTGKRVKRVYIFQNGVRLGADKFFVYFLKKRTVFGNLWGGPHVRYGV